MSAYENVVGGKLKLKGKALDVKAGGMKKKKKQKKQYEQISQAVESEFSASLLVILFSLKMPAPYLLRRRTYSTCLCHIIFLILCVLVLL